MAAPTTKPLPEYMTGKQGTLFQVQGASLNGSGNLVYTTAVDHFALGIFRSMTYQGRRQTVDIKPSHFTVENHVPISVGFNIDLTDIRLDDGYDSLNDIFASGRPIFRVLCQNTGILGAGYVFCALGTVTSNSFNQAEGEHNGSLSLVPIGIPAYYGVSGSNPI